MRLGKRLAGLALAALGAIGIVVCLAGVACVWIVASRLHQFNSQVFGQAQRLVVEVDRHAAKARDAVGDTRDLVDALKGALQERAKELTAERVLSLPEIDNLERRLASAMERADGLIEVSASTAELVEQLIATVGVMAAQRNADLRGSAELMAAIRSARESLANASQHLADVQHRLAEIRQRHDVDVNLSQITKLSFGIVARLDIVQEQIAALRSRLDDTKTRLGQWQDRTKAWILAGECLVLLLIGWGGAGQYCLLLQGWRIVRPASSENG